MKHRFLIDTTGQKYVPVSHAKSTFVSKDTVLSDFFTAQKNNILQNGTFQKKRITVSDGVFSISDNTHYTGILVDVKPYTTYYLNRSQYSSTANSTNYVVLIGFDDSLSSVLWADGSEGASAVMQVFPNGGVFKTRSNTKQVYIMLDYSTVSADDRDLYPDEYLIESNVAVFPNSYNTSPSIAGEKKEYKILLIGSSYGVNTIMALPPLAKSAGIDIAVGNIYGSSASIETSAAHCNDTDILDYGYFDTKTGFVYKGGNTDISTRGYKRTTYQILQNEAWDCVILMRAAVQSTTAWSDSNSTALDTLIDYITANCPSHPKILFDSAWAGGSSASYTKADLATLQTQTDNINAAVETMKSKFGLPTIPVASFIQACRADDTIDADGLIMNNNCGIHLNPGIGMYATACLCFEYLLAPVFGKSILTQSHIHTNAELQLIYNNPSTYPVMTVTDANFVTPSDAQAKMIRKLASIACHG